MVRGGEAFDDHVIVVERQGRVDLDDGHVHSGITRLGGLRLGPGGIGLTDGALGVDAGARVNGLVTDGAAHAGRERSVVVL